jgi:hypothetical protein
MCIDKLSYHIKAVGFSTTLAPSMSTLLLDGLMAQLSQRLNVDGVDLVKRPFYGFPDFNCPLLAICVNVSRIGADAKEALKGVAKGNLLCTENFYLLSVFVGYFPLSIKVDVET